MNFRLLLLPFSLIYSIVAGLRNSFFNIGIFKQFKFDFPIILIGNLSVGGTGKTPHVEYLIRLLQKDHKIATLSRGHGRKSKGFVIAGKGSNAQIIGDEPMQYHSKFEDITVAVCEKRVKAVSRLLGLPNKPDLIIMDDGYQHRSLNAGFKILLTPFEKMFTRDFVLPAGDLRESYLGYKRADCIVITRSSTELAPEIKAKIIREISPVKNQQVFFSSLVYDQPTSFFNKDVVQISDLKKYSVLLFTGIAKPQALEHFVKSNATNVDCVHFSDHHNYSSADINNLIKKFDKFANRSAILLTTEKDYNRLKGSPSFEKLRNLPCYYIPVTVKIDREEAFNSLIKNYVAQNKRNS